MEDYLGYFIAVGFRLFLGYSLLLFVLSFMFRLFRKLWDLVFDFIDRIKKTKIKF